jgi:hypothetical protein
VRRQSRITALNACALSVALGCGSSGSEPPAAAGYACQIKAIVLAGFQGSCDMRSAGNPTGQCREWWGTQNVDVQSACADLGGAFDAASNCPSDSRVLRCYVGESTLRILYSYYAPSYTEANAAADCTGLGGSCLTGPGG